MWKFFTESKSKMVCDKMFLYVLKQGFCSGNFSSRFAVVYCQVPVLSKSRVLTFKQPG
jgi:hypothetical protein